MTFTDKEIAN